MLNCFVIDSTTTPIPIEIIIKENYQHWLTSQAIFVRNWLEANKFIADVGNFYLLPTAQGQIEKVILCLNKLEDWSYIGCLPLALPEGVYQLDFSFPYFFDAAKTWGLGAYQFSRYQSMSRPAAQLLIPENKAAAIHSFVQSIYWVRDCINTPAEEMGPTELANDIKTIAEKFNADYQQIVGEDLQTEHYPLIYTVGRASDDAPRLIDFRWGKPNHFKLTLVGKGVCFDSGGLNIKPAFYMALMKKDMGGAANVMGLAQLIMAANLPINLRVLIPAVENVISGNAVRPGDVLQSRKGLTVEIGNTDAEGRLVLADALTEASEEEPNLLIDIATLTGAARVALGPDIPVFFTNQEKMVSPLLEHSKKTGDIIWQLPLFDGYRDYIKSPIANINNNSVEPFAGAITAALFLKEFVPDHIPWIHFDIMAWNIRNKPGKPIGGEAMGIEALFSYIKTVVDKRLA